MKILDALLVLKEQVVKGCVKYSDMGICFNLNCLLVDNSIDGSPVGYYFVEDNCSDWEHFSGDSVYPIDNYLDKPLWEGKQLELRLSLIDHLIAKAKHQGV